MKALRRRTVPVLFAMALAAAVLALVWRPMRGAQRFHVPSEQEAAAAQRLFGRALKDPGSIKALGRDAGALGLAPSTLGAPQGLVLSETEVDCAGRGAYVLRAGAAAPLALVAPHRGADRHTGTIARLLFEEQRVVAAAWNTAPRRSDGDCSAGGDVAREPTHYITAFSLAVAQRFPQGRIVQLHGFDPERRASSNAYAADAILSDGTDRPPVQLVELARCLNRTFPQRRFAVYGIDTDELGATGNAQGRALHDAGFAGFVHVEMAGSLRALLVADPAARALFFSCLAADL